MKKFLTILLASTIIFCCVACQTQNTTTNSVEVSSSSSASSTVSRPPETVLPEESLSYTDVSLANLSAEQQSAIDELFYVNNLDTKSADPACVYNEEDGYFYLYGTGHYNFPCWKSRDLTNWQSVGLAFNEANRMSYSDVSGVMTESEFDKYKQETWIKYGYDWAPGVIYDAELDLYLMFFSSRYGNSEPIKLQLTLATSKTPYGPFIQWTGKVNGANGAEGVETITYANGQTVSAYEIGYGDVFIDFERLNGINGNYPYEGYIKAIDVEPFVDPVTGDKYIFFCRDLGDKYSQSYSMGMKMIDWFTPDYSTLTLLTRPNYTKLDDATPFLFKDEGDVNEGQYVVYNPENQLYYLTYSCNGYTDRSYRVKQAWATSPLGPYTKIDNTKGGNVIATDLNWLHRAGTGHHVFTRVGNEMYIIYHMHTTPKKWNGQRSIGIDKVTWVENEDGILVMNTGGPSYDYRLKPSALTGYTNLASKASVWVSQQKENTSFNYLTDGAIQMMIGEGINEFKANKAELEVILTFTEPITLKGIMAINSYYIETAFDKITKIEVDYERDGTMYRGVTGEVIFDWDKYCYTNLDDNGSYNYIPGCGSTALFDDIQNVYRVKIIFKNQKWNTVQGLSISDIAIIGK